MDVRVHVPVYLRVRAHLFTITSSQGWDLGPVPVFEAAVLETENDDDDEEDDTGGDLSFKGRAKAKPGDTRRVWREERARFEAAVQARRQQGKGEGWLSLPHLPPALSLSSPGVMSGVRSPFSPLLQVLSSLTAGGAEPDEEEEEELEEAEAAEAVELLAFAAAWRPSMEEAGATTTMKTAGSSLLPPLTRRTRSAGSMGSVVVMLASGLLSSLPRRLLPLLLLTGGLPWLFHHRHYHQASSPRLLHQASVLVLTAMLRQLGVALVFPRSRALRRAAFGLSALSLLAATTALAFLSFPSRTAATAASVWAQIQRTEAVSLPLLLWLYGEGRRAWRWCLRWRRRRWEEWGYAFSDEAVQLEGTIEIGKHHVD